MWVLPQAQGRSGNCLLQVGVFQDLESSKCSWMTEVDKISRAWSGRLQTQPPRLVF